jgi:hypothetical protein
MQSFGLGFERARRDLLSAQSGHAVPSALMMPPTTFPEAAMPAEPLRTYLAEFQGNP